MSDIDLEDAYAFAVGLAKQAGQMLLDAADRRILNSSNGSMDYDEKDNAVDIVTQTDNGALLSSMYCLGCRRSRVPLPWLPCYSTNHNDDWTQTLKPLFMLVSRPDVLLMR
jgi:myo-inositol-1(or 4)-monophosphatase